MLFQILKSVYLLSCLVHTLRGKNLSAKEQILHILVSYDFASWHGGIHIDHLLREAKYA
jgi:hypothetical protein